MKYEAVRLIEPPHVEGIILIPTVPQPRAAHTGWTVFAGLVMIVIGLWNIVWGFFEIANDYYFSGDTLMSGSHSLWGWLYIGAGLVMLLVAPLVFVRNPAGVFLGFVVVACNALFHVLGFGHRFWWSVVVLALDVVVLYALANYGIRVQEPRQRAAAAG